MAYILQKVGNTTNTPVEYYEVDTITQRDALDTSKMTMGSECFVINENKNYVLNSSKEWKQGTPIR